MIAELVEIGELDDERFAYAFAEDKRELSGWGSERIEAALADRGLGRSLAERAAAEPRDAQLERAAPCSRAAGEDLADEAGASPGALVPDPARLRVRARLRRDPGPPRDARRGAKTGRARLIDARRPPRRGRVR